VSSGAPSLPELRESAERHAREAEQYRAEAEQHRAEGLTHQAEAAAYRAQMAELWHEKTLVEIEAFDDSGASELSVEELRADLQRLKLQVANLRIALQSNRRISMAVGILMSRHGLTADEAFDSLRAVSQTTHSKLHDIADAVIYVGDFPEGTGPIDGFAP
jgi:hypothetical protein